MGMPVCLPTASNNELSICGLYVELLKSDLFSFGKDLQWLLRIAGKNINESRALIESQSNTASFYKKMKMFF